MGYLVLLVFYAMVVILTLDMTRYMDTGAAPADDQPVAAPARRPRPALVRMFGRALRSKRMSALR